MKTRLQLTSGAPPLTLIPPLLLLPLLLQTISLHPLPIEAQVSQHPQNTLSPGDPILGSHSNDPGIPEVSGDPSSSASVIPGFGSSVLPQRVGNPMVDEGTDGVGEAGRVGGAKGAEGAGGAKADYEAMWAQPSVLAATQRGANAKQLIPASGVISLCLSQGGGLLNISATNVQNGTWEGWGTSLAWFAHFIGGLPTKQLNILLDLMFNQVNGLGLNIVRYNIGGGFNPAISTQFNKPDSPLRFRGMPGFKPQATGPYNWTADAEQRAVLLGAKARGADTFVAFSNSPPWWMTVSGDVAGNSAANKCNLKSQYFPAFADYLTEVVKQYATNPQWGVQFQYLNPFNEPLEGFWQKGKRHEGCYFNANQMSSVITLVQASLKQKGLSSLTSVVGIDSAGLFSKGGFNNMNPAARSSLDAFHIHGYVYGSSLDPAVAATYAYTSAQQLGKTYNKEIWQSEWGPSTCQGQDLDFALCMARYIIQSVNIMNARAWVYWQAIDYAAPWSLINVPWSYKAPFTYTLSKKYFILKQFSRYVTRGSIIIAVPGSACKHSTAAFYDPRYNRLVVFVLNELTTSQRIKIIFNGFRPSTHHNPSIRGFISTTSATKDYGGPSLMRTPTLGPFTYVYQARSLTRISFYNVARPQ